MSSSPKKSFEWMGPWDLVLQHIGRETGHDAVDCELLARELAQIHPLLQEELLKWWSTGQVDFDRQIAGHSIRSLTAPIGPCSYVVEAYTWLSGLLTTPERTLSMIDRPIGMVVGFKDPSSDD